MMISENVLIALIAGGAVAVPSTIFGILGFIVQLRSLKASENNGKAVAEVKSSVEAVKTTVVDVKKQTDGLLAAAKSTSHAEGVDEGTTKGVAAVLAAQAASPTT